MGMRTLFWMPYLGLAYVYREIGELFWYLYWGRGWTDAALIKIRNRFIVKSVDLLEGLIKYLTEEDDIMARITGIKSDQVHEFTPKGQDDIAEEERAIFLCKFLNVRLSAQITDEVYSAKGFGKGREELLKAGTQEMKILRQGLVGWKNFNYEDGKEIVWEEVNRSSSVQKQAAAMDKNLDKIPPEVRGEIADFVRGQSTPDLD